MSEYHYTVSVDEKQVLSVFSPDDKTAFEATMDWAYSIEVNSPAKVFQHVNGKKIPIYFSEKGFV